MAITFHSNISTLLIGSGILKGGLNTSSAFSIYSGTQPDSATILAAWPSYSSSNSSFLAHYSGAIWSQPSFNTNSMASITTLPTVYDTINTGTGTWAILWGGNPLLAAMGSASIPTTSFIIVPISALPGIGTIRFDADTEFTAGVAKQIVDGVFSAAII